ncbi:MAG TPA: family 78 glycoside hydrolase catalytic domain [Candidatus Merdenecus merdavium]|nr:family 78 glycoside hydrolase catalytic domain [Candidatus Merdenecus merdavium]
MKAVGLKVEYLTKPLGLDVVKPRFFWNCSEGIEQSAYQIIVKREKEILWDSGKIASSQMTNIRYGGKNLLSRDRILWQVRLWDERDLPGEIVEDTFEMGLLDEDDWTAKWITGDYKPRKNVRYPVDYFKKKFAVRSGMRSARLYITACGLYKAEVNGQRVGRFCLAPGCTDYRFRLQYQVYDVTDLLNTEEENRLEVQLADGWYRGSIGCFGLTNVFGRQTKVLCQMEIEYEDGFRETIGSDASFQWSNDGPIRFADLKDGEIYDASYMPSYNGNAKETIEVIKPTAANNVEPVEQELFSGKLIRTTSGKTVIDFGQNIAGFLSFRIKGEKGQKLKLLCGEIIDENGEFTQKNIQVKKPIKEFGKITELLLITGKEDKIHGELQPTPKQEIEFLCSGNEDTYKMEFSVFGFRYALIETEVPFVAEDFKAIAVYSDMERSGTFSCSNKRINRFFENTVWSMKSNFLDVPTDCPTRERLGWTGDGQIFFRTAAYLMNVAPFFRKWLLDIRDGQFKNGKSSAVVPYQGASMLYDNTGGSVGWGDAIVLIPYRYWKCYGEREILIEFYDMMKKYAMFMIKNTGHKSKAEAKKNPYNKYVYEKGMHLGEWLEPEEFKDKEIGMKVLHTEEATAYLHYTMKHMTEIAEELGKKEDGALFKEYAQGAKKAYEYLFLSTGTIDTERQAKLVRPLALGLVEGEIRENLEKRLVKAVENRRYCIGTGFLSTPFILPVLTKAGHVETAYKILENENAPSWLAEVKAGATTVWEDWEGTASHNHYSPGAVCEWFFHTVAGIQVRGKQQFQIEPIPGGSLTFAKAEYQSIYGEVKSSWERKKTEFIFHISIPVNTAATIILPDGQKHEVKSGDYCYHMGYTGGEKCQEKK